MMKLKKFSLFAFGVFLTAGAATAQNYPAKPVRVIVPFPPAGAADIVARHASNALSEAFGVQFVVENRAGAGGAIGGEAAARAAPDGYTLLMASSSTMSINPHLAARQTYDPLTSFAPIVLVGYAPNVVAVHPSVPVRTIRELIALAKAKPDALSFSSNGTGTISHLTGELFMQRAGVRMLHVPYKGAAGAVIDVLAGQVTMLFAAYPSIAAQERAGKLRALAVTSSMRMQLAPNLPTVAEAALPGFESNQWWAYYGPAGLPAAIVSRLNAELNKILHSEDLRKKYAADGVEAGGGAPAELATYLKNDFERWGKVVKAAGIKPE
jgi:tripartite-type tricarboxylate transporter receptor subunit TctC